LTELDRRNIGFVELVETNNKARNVQERLFPKKPREQISDVAKTLRPFFKGLLVGNYGYTPESGLEQIQASVIDAVTFGGFYISNPDLAERIVSGVKINTNFDYQSFYGAPGQEKGYTDYPFYVSQ
jgi:2,4-dienoyl-CoA reductase-like NADH-dependent reductase (Old Yellow Enzyme family)